jgi:pimeloyl-ACP methyl ester carboxylesterase
MGLVTRLLLCLNGGGLPEQEREQLFKFNKAPGTARAFARMTRDVIRLRGQTRHFLERAAELGSLPAMALFWGDKDRIIPIRHGEALTRALDHCELRRFPGAGHFLHWDHPGELSAALIGYLSTPQIAPARLLAVAGSGVTAAALPGRAALSGPKNETPTE